MTPLELRRYVRSALEVTLVHITDHNDDDDDDDEHSLTVRDNSQ